MTDRKKNFWTIRSRKTPSFCDLQKSAQYQVGKKVLEYSEERLEAGREVLAENLLLRIQGPQHVGIVGRNGCGKTTFLRKIAQVFLERKDLKAAYMPQNYEESMDLEKTAVEFLTKTGEREEEKRIRTYLGSMKYTADEMVHPMKELSGGQKAKLFFLKMSMEGSQVLVLDEPTRNFSPLSNPVIRNMLKEFPGKRLSAFLMIGIFKRSLQRDL